MQIQFVVNQLLLLLFYICNICVCWPKKRLSFYYFSISRSHLNGTRSESVGWRGIEFITALQRNCSLRLPQAALLLTS